MLPKKCECGRWVFFKKFLYKGEYFCPECYAKHKQRDEEKQKKIEEEKKKKRAEEKNKIADKKLREELKSPKKPQKKVRKSQEKKEPEDEESKKEEPKQQEEKIGKKETGRNNFSKEEINKYDKLLLVEASVKKVKAIEWIDGKKRIAVNKEREIRRTHAGGFSQEKFQKFVDAKKKQTVDWIKDVLNRPGVLREGYDKILVSADNEELKSEIERFLDDYQV